MERKLDTQFDGEVLFNKKVSTGKNEPFALGKHLAIPANGVSGEGYKLYAGTDGALFLKYSTDCLTDGGTITSLLQKDPNNGALRILSELIVYQNLTSIGHILPNADNGCSVGATNKRFISGHFNGVVSSGANTTANRPTANLIAGAMFFDTTLNKPIWRNAANNGWVDATGTSV